MKRKSIASQETTQDSKNEAEGEIKSPSSEDELDVACPKRSKLEINKIKGNYNEKSKRFKLSKDYLYKPPTSQELNTLKETENLFHSSLFRLQVEELLSELKFVKKTSSDDWITKLKSCLLVLPCGESHDINDLTWIEEMGMKLPLCHRPYAAKGVFQFLPPTDVKVIGEYSLGISCKPKAEIHIAVEIPKKCFHHIDYLNHRYHLKRAMYLLCLAKALLKEDFVSELKYAYFNGDNLKPTLQVSPKGKLSKKLVVSILPYPPKDFFQLSRFIPKRNNARPSWFFHQDQEDDNIPTPRYNSSILHDIMLDQNSEYASSILSGADGVKDGIILLKVWAHQRELDRGFGGFSPFIQIMYVVYLMQAKKLNRMMSSYQVVRNVWVNLAQSDWTQKGISLSQVVTDNQPCLDEFHELFETVFVDTLGFQNICANMSATTFHRVRNEASMAVKLLDEGNSGVFDALFMIPLPFIHAFDQILHIANNIRLKTACDKLNLSAGLLDNGGSAAIAILPKIVENLQSGLGNRIHLLDVRLRNDVTWPVLDSAPTDCASDITIGFLLDASVSSSLLDKGPLAESPEALIFREFWGEKSELRRFQDGSICEAVVWPGSTIADKRMVCRHIVNHILFRHLHISELNTVFVGHEMDSIISMCIPDNQSEATKALKLGTGEEQTAAALQAFDKLSKHLRKLDVVLSINSVQGISPLFRYTEVFPPSPITGKISKRLERIEGDHVLLKGSLNSSPHLNKPFEAVVQLESSGKWPQSTEAIRRLKAAFHIKLGNLLEKEHHLRCIPQTEFVDVLIDGYVFRLRVVSQNEIVALSQEIRGNKSQNVEQALAVEMTTEILPKITSALHGLQMQYGSYGSTAQLVKRWISAQLLLEHVSEVCIDLIVAHLYVSSSPFMPPSCPQVGFLRFLHLFSKFDWKNGPLIVNLNNELKQDAITDIQSKFTATRSNLPAMCVLTPYDKSRSLWSKGLPTPQILHRLILLTTEASKVLDVHLASPVDGFDYKSIFRPPLDPYDVIIHLNSWHVQTTNQAVDVECSKRFHYVKDEAVECKATPVVNYNPVALYLKELRETFSEFALFFYDHYGGKYIAVLWKPKAFEPQPFKVTNANGRMVLPRSTEQNILLTPNVATLIEDFANIGQGIVHKIETKSGKWDFVD